jgi:glycine oxidase
MPFRADRPHTVVIGGGITGAFAAFSLARRGFGVTLLERGEIAGEASGNNPGGLNPLHGPGIPGPLAKLALESFQLHVDSWDEIRELSQIDFAPRIAPRVHIALDDDDVAELDRMKDLYDSTAGFTAEWMERDELEAMEPRLSPAVVRGLWTDGNGKVSSARYTRAVVAASVALGARLVTGDARGLRREGGRATGVLLEDGCIDCDAVVLATGPWCVEPARWLGIAVPVEPVKGELVLVRPDGGGIRVDLARRDAAVYGTGGADVWLGGTEERAGFDWRPTAAARETVLARAAQLMPELERAQVLRQTAALRPATPDGLPIVGAANGWENVFLALGGGRKGVLLSTGIARAAAEFVTAPSAAPVAEAVPC